MTPDYLDSSMRRTDLAWHDWPAIEAFLRDELICRAVVNDAPFPYVVPQSFTFTGDAFLIHCTRFGRFSRLIQQNPHIVIAVDRPVALLKAPKGQNTSLEYYSVIARCRATVSLDTPHVIAHQNEALAKFRPENDHTPIEQGAANQIMAIRCRIESLSAKKRILADGQYSPPGLPQAPYLRYPFERGACVSGLPAGAFDPQRFDRRT
ncbi:pyridoxamine 5'-phosphate oxidase family protein [Pandoraea anhela]|uniref:Flavin-nucleotide-binding protein n=1 Tax=Pandoraea anhela TaxID=2508295 RepID=A0A5E4YRK2_9BURK|nr:pyridoxamine 5'-phosphate oxidase family protein [Pandoraea anhela]VVE51504.1 flavin-nucleotide-binding protein [Pandoraea anhela]